MKVFIAGIALACAGTVVAQFAMTPHPEQAQAAPAVDVPTPEPTFQHITSLPFDAATYNMNQSIPYGTVDGPDPAKLWDESGDSTARSAEGWDGVSPPDPAASATASKTGKSTGTSASGSKLSVGKAPKVSKPGGSGVGASKPKAPAVVRIAQGTKGGLATPGALSQGPSVKPRKIPIY